MVTSYVNTTAILQSERSFKGEKEGRQRRSGSPLERGTKYIASSHGDYFLEKHHGHSNAMSQRILPVRVDRSSTFFTCFGPGRSLSGVFPGARV